MKLDYASRICYSSLETLHFTFNVAESLKDTEGDFVECGVAAGAQIIAMRCGAPDKVIHAFDSFEGIPLPSNRDNQMPGIRVLSKSEIRHLPSPGNQLLESSGATAVSEDDFWGHIQGAGLNKENIITHKGWFENTLPENHIEKISLLRLDGDLYNSTYVCLEHLFQKVVKGGVVIIDDWNLSGCRAACDDYFKKINYHPAYRTVSDIKYLTV